MRRFVLPIGTAAVLWACTSTTATPSAAGPDALSRRMTDVSRRLRTRGYTELGAPVREFLIEHQASPRPVTLRSGTCYTFVAVASRAVRDLDLRLFDPSGAEVARDSTTDAHPVVQYCPPASGAYYRVARMAAGNGLSLSALYSSPPGVGGSLDDLFDPLGADPWPDPGAGTAVGP